MPHTSTGIALLSLLLGLGGPPRPPRCEPLDKGDCNECYAEKCCDLLRLCTANADCACLAKCTGRASLTGVAGCLRACGLSGSPPGFIPLAECAADACPDRDECSTPAGFKPPPNMSPAAPPSPADSGKTGKSGETGKTGKLGAGALPDCGFDRRRFDPKGPVLQLESADKRVCVRLERRKDGPGHLANTNFTLLNMTIGPLREVTLIKDQSSLCWYASHHNFKDWAHAWAGTRHYDLEMKERGHRGRRTYTLHTFEAGPLRPGACAPVADGARPIGAPIELQPVNP